ncbi:MAG: hypothetical protein C5B54_00840 [Acidobacteria bacterium]|nr:MAG: hypothetical protein C5B54_00840 [Acidobacteriota bacterium]
MTFTDNAAARGAGIYNEDATTTLGNATIAGNIAGDTGGALFNNNTGTVTLTNSTLNNNTGYAGGGAIQSEGSTGLMNTIVANSFQGFSCAGGTPNISLGHNLESGDTCHFQAGYGDLVNADPLLLPLSNNGKKGYTQSFALAKGSPAIDKGSNNGCVSKDQRARKRPIDGDGNGSAICDIGSFEFKP